MIKFDNILKDAPYKKFEEYYKLAESAGQSSIEAVAISSFSIGNFFSIISFPPKYIKVTVIGFFESKNGFSIVLLMVFKGFRGWILFYISTGQMH